MLKNGIGSDDKSTLLLTCVIFLTGVVAVLSVVLGIRLIRWIRIYRLTNRNRFARRLFTPTHNREDSLLTVQYHQPTTTNSRSLCLLREWIDLEDPIGQGCFGQVYRGRLRRPVTAYQDSSYINTDDSETVAIKIFKGQTGTSLATGQEELIREAEIMAALSHENILALRGIVFNGDGVIFFMYLKFSC